MLEFNELLKLMEKVNELNYDEFSLSHGSLKIEMKKNGSSSIVPLKKQAVQTTPVVEEKKVVESNNYRVITSPMVGTFYSKSSPESPDFVSVGDKVNPNTTVCIVEAMKLFNEIQAEISGEIVEVLVENGQLVEFGQPLFHIR